MSSTRYTKIAETKPVLVTGCSSGIGLCVAQGLQKRGYPVFASARKADDVEKLQEKGLTTLQLDLDDSQSIEHAVNHLLSQTGNQLYAVFHNGAYGQPGAVEDISRDVLRQQLETNLLGWHELTNRVLPVMRKQGAGRLIYNSSILGFVPMAYRGAYTCSKYALEGLVDTLRLELRGSGIHTSLIEPGPIRSRFRQNAYEKFRENVDANNSFHKPQYDNMQQRLNKKGDAQPFTLPPEAVLKRVIHALESNRPRSRYPVTFPTYLFATLKRILPTSAIDYLLMKASGGGKR